MTTRTVSVLLLFAVASIATGVVLALSLSGCARAGIEPGRWLMHEVMFVCFVGVFFVGRHALLPPRLATPWGTALATLSVWLGVTLLVATGVAALVVPLFRGVGFGHGTAVVLLACVLASVGVLDRVAARRRLP